MEAGRIMRPEVDLDEDGDGVVSIEEQRRGEQDRKAAAAITEVNRKKREAKVTKQNNKRSMQTRKKEQSKETDFMKDTETHMDNPLKNPAAAAAPKNVEAL